MAQWIVFDETTATAVQARTGGSVDMRSGGDSQPAAVIAQAAAAPGPAIAMIPASDSKQALLLRFTRNPCPTTNETPPLASTTRVAPGGFLGLADELVLEEEPAPPKKWWQKILD